MATIDLAAASTLSGLGADLSVSISFVLASEFVAAAREAELADDELVTLLIVAVVTLTSVKSFVSGRVKKAAALARAATAAASVSAGSSKEPGGDDDGIAVAAEGAADTIETSADTRGVLEFSLLMLNIAQRICLSISVQVVAFAVKNDASSRIVRVTTLLGVVVFFVFFESASKTKTFV
mgnify:CR=1 FL=1